MRKALARFLLISFTSDWLYPPRDSQEIAAALQANGQNPEYHNIDVPYGHDSFLLETEDQTPLISGFLRAVIQRSLNMSVDSQHDFGFDTRAIHAGQRPEPYTGARAVPIFQTTSYVFEDTDAAAAYFNLQEYGNTYSRIMNPTVAVFEERIANLEGGVGGVAFASGLAAQASALFTMLQPGDHIVASSALYGGSVTQLKHLSRKLSLDLTFVDPDNLNDWRDAIRHADQSPVCRNDRKSRWQCAGHRIHRNDCARTWDAARD